MSHELHVDVPAAGEPGGALLPLPCTFGRYRLTSLLAVGGMAQIYLAKAFGAEGFVKRLVIKRLDPRLAARASLTRLFINEAKLLVSLNHGNIVPVFDFGRVGDDLYMAMEYVDGCSLDDLLKSLAGQGETIDLELAAYIVAEVCKGLDYAHRRLDERAQPAGIIHRDIKPRNVLISSEGEVKIVDFGVAKLASRIEAPDALSGTVSYMSPEQAACGTVDHRTDIFSAGLMLYELCAGRRAYEAASATEVLELARRGTHMPLPARVPAELRAAVDRATAIAPAERYATAHQLESVLGEFLLLTRAAGATPDSVSSAAKLRALMQRQQLAGPSDGPSDDANERKLLAETITSPGNAIIVDDEAAQGAHRSPDLQLLNRAAQTFHSEFLTRVIQLETVGTRPPWPRKLRWAAIAAAALAMAGLATFVGWRPPTSSPRTLQARPRTTERRLSTRLVASPPADHRRPQPFTDEDLRVPAAAPSTGAGSQPPRQADRPATDSARRTQYGYLSINSIPWSKVTVDGKTFDRPTPLLSLRLRAGRHTVTLENPELGLRKQITVRIQPGQTISKVVRLRW